MKAYTALGVDPGIKNTAIAWVRSDGSRYSLLHLESFTTDPKLNTGERLSALWNPIMKMYRRMLNTAIPDAVGIENVFFNKNVSSALSTAKVIGMLEHTFTSRELPYFLLRPQTVKKAVGAKPTAKKSELLPYTARLVNFNVPAKPTHHEIDAIACAIATILELKVPGGTV